MSQHFHTEDMFLIYHIVGKDQYVCRHYLDTPENGNYSHPETGEDLRLVGWSPTVPENMEQIDTLYPKPSFGLI